MATKKKGAAPAAPAAPAPPTDATKKGPRVAIGDIAEVQEYMDLQAEIDALKAEHPRVFMQLADLVDRRNAALEVAEAKVRAEGVSCGPFDNFSVSIVYNPDKMYEELGEELFLKCGGKLQQVTKRTCDAKLVDAAIATGAVPEPCVGEFRTVTYKYHAPKKISI